MGIQDRDYYREGPSFFDRVSAQGATVWLIAITCGVYFAQCLTGDAFASRHLGPVTGFGIYDPDLIWNKVQVWRLFTPVFLHGSPWHLFVNMLVLYWTGQRLEQVYGSREFTIFYLLSGIGANIIYFLVQHTNLIPPSQALGASGATTAVMVLYAFHFPHQIVRIWFILPMPMWLMTILYIAFEALAGMGEVRGRGDGIGHFAHLGGALCGFLYFRLGIQFTALFRRRERRETNRVQPKLRVHSPPVQEEAEEKPPRTREPARSPSEAPPKPSNSADEHLEAKLDAILEKVSKYGKECLTPEEHEILNRASELYKKRRK